MADAIAQQGADPEVRRLATESPGIDWVLGGGIPVGIALLIASPAGCGKSTLLVEMLRKIALFKTDVLYCSSEETTQQMARRYARLGKFPARMKIIHEQDIEAISEMIRRDRPRVAAVDSLHDLDNVTDSNFQSYSIGSPSAVTLAAKALKKLAAAEGVSLFVVAHVTKEGDLAGANTVQHSLDGTLYLNGQKKEIDGREVIVGRERTLRLDGKYRFGATGRVARFQMDPDGLHDRGPWRDSRPPWAVHGNDMIEAPAGAE